MKKRFCSFFTLAAVLFLTACAKVDDAGSQQAPVENVTVYTGGPIYTGVDEAPRAEAVAVSGGVILAVGTRDLVIEGAGDNPDIIDLNGAALYPGFTDAHAHFFGIGMRELTLNLEGVGSVEELVSIVAANVQHTGESETIVGRGWIETGWPEGRMPTRDDLDPVSPDNPVLLSRADGHALVANSAALDASGIDDATPDPEGGKIERDENGRATGILIDNAMSLVGGLVSAPTEETKRNAFEKASDVYAAYGWTGLHNMSVDPANVPVMEEMSDENLINVRIYNSIDQSGLDAIISNGPSTSDNGHVITNAMKLYVDGALGSRGAALSEPYSDRPDTSGLLLMNEQEATALLDKAIAAGVQVNTHAIGDRGNKLVLDWYEDVFARHPDKDDMRWRIEHAQIVHVEDIPRFAELGVIPSMQPSHAIGDLFFAPDRLGPDRLDGAYAWRSLIDAGAVIAAGSDAPVERGDPLIEFYAAVARRGLDGTQTEDWRPSQAVSREEALKMFTLWPAYASFQENELGAIEPGKRADFTVFSKDIMTVPEDEILSAKPVMTVVDGEIVFKAEG
ncbi:amidohydrolase [Hyphococcus flavus]|uniref:Amidohydrolase n=1 Tax=Hyphococcus flavus TaxID=1866326 RepID=A0AAF0CB83_9PROT|nr:amidohydrolase [Hyphococcus flavus]WDI30220.1 amidohydrolase [Hyphococcus flavus]